MSPRWLQLRIASRDRGTIYSALLWQALRTRPIGPTPLPQRHAEQGSKLMAMLEAVVDSLDRFEPMRVQLEELGRKHAGYGVRLGQYDTLAAALLWSIAQALGADFDPATRQAWKMAIEAVNGAMKSGANSPLPQ
jgi:hemoglobin-like flavoprotein